MRTVLDILAGSVVGTVIGILIFQFVVLPILRRFD